MTTGSEQVAKLLIELGRTNTQHPVHRAKRAAAVKALTNENEITPRAKKLTLDNIVVIYMKSGGVSGFRRPSPHTPPI